MYTAVEIEITFKGIDLKPEKLLTIQLTQRFNDHARLEFTRIVAEENLLIYQKMVQAPPPVRVECQEKTFWGREKDSMGVCVFQGIVTEMALDYHHEEQHYRITVKGISFTYLLDSMPRSRSFPDGTMTYRDLLGTIVAPRNIQYQVAERPIDRFLLQYQETDWEFLKRLASHFKTGLIADAAGERPRFAFGPPEGLAKRFPLRFLKTTKAIGKYRQAQLTNQLEMMNPGTRLSRSEPEPWEVDFIDYQWRSGEIVNVGDEVEWPEKRIMLRVKAVLGKLYGSELQFVYTLTTKYGLHQPILHNPRLSGVSLEGTVTGLERDRVNVRLALDGAETKKIGQFPCSTFYPGENHTGWYCMPEVDDTVMIYFPTVREEEGLVLTSLRLREKVSARTEDPDHEYFRTRHGKEVHFGLESVTLSANETKDQEVHLHLDQAKGAEIRAATRITIRGNGDIALKSLGKSVILTAEKSLTLTAKEGQSQILVDGSGVDIKGKKVNKSAATGSQKQAENQTMVAATAVATQAQPAQETQEFYIEASPAFPWYIDETPAMPDGEFTAKLTHPKQVEAEYEWEINIRYNSQSGHGQGEGSGESNQSHKLFVARGKDANISLRKVMEEHQLGLCGDDLQVKAVAYVGEERFEAELTDGRILGKNPEKEQVREYVHTCTEELLPEIQKKHPQYKAVQSEIDLAVLSKSGGKQFNIASANDGLPNWNSPNRWGIAQRDEQPNEAILWDWRQNVREGVRAVLEEKAAATDWKFDRDPLDVMKLRRNKRSNTFGDDVRVDIETGEPKAHQGVDLYAPIGTPIKAVADGTVVTAEEHPEDKRNFGTVVVLKFEKNSQTYYAKYCHLSEIDKSIYDIDKGKNEKGLNWAKKGNRVTAGQVLGKTGITGNAVTMKGEDLHLHFELNVEDRWPLGCSPRIDPYPHFNADDEKMEVKY